MLALVLVQVHEEVHEEVEAQVAVVEMADALVIGDEVVKVVLEAQVVQEAQEVEVLEVQDHPSRRLLPDHAALAHLGRCPEVQHPLQRRLGLQGHRRRPEAGQRH